MGLRNSTLEVGGGGKIFSSQANVCMGKMTSIAWGNDSAQETRVSAFWDLTPEPPTSAHTALVHSDLPLPDLKMSVCTQNFMCWPFKRVPAFPAHLSLPDSSPAAFHSQMLCGYLSQFWWALLGPRVLSGNSPQLRSLSLELQLLSVEGTPDLLASPPFLPVSRWSPLYVLGYQSSLQLISHWLFRIFLYSTCNSSLVLGACLCSIHLLHHHF